MPPGRLLRAGATPSGVTKIAVSPAACGARVIVSSVPPATGFSVKAVTAAGAGPGDAAVVLKTNGIVRRGQGMLPAGTSVARYHPPGAPASRSSPGSCDPTS